MFNNNYYDPLMENDFNRNRDPEEENQDSIPEGEDIPERIE